MAELDKLRSMDKNARPGRARFLLDRGHLKADGSALFRYHAANRFHVPRHNAFVAMGHAEFASGIWWAKLSDQQQQYWVRQTENLLAGSTGPLDQETFDDFKADHISLLDEDLPEDDRDPPSYCQLPTPESSKSVAGFEAPIAQDEAPGSDTSDDFWDAPSEPGVHAADEPNTINDYCSLLAVLTPKQIKAKNAHWFAGLASKFSVDGQTLFLYHASAWADQEMAKAQGAHDEAALMVDAWQSLDQLEKV
ncbi:hypothetical protein LTR36_002268 [Oleoguttula mirabilis]|uniref:Uncharacterized protein n=1 Tax=Oleoguttula mirabilis TaxID=1507867 RepID=A0AAV9JMB2_9PEZI|nr:hypothetical protein LTR36_002268 [Oleoguttula mirabilis]